MIRRRSPCPVHINRAKNADGNLDTVNYLTKRIVRWAVLHLVHAAVIPPQPQKFCHQTKSEETIRRDSPEALIDLRYHSTARRGKIPCDINFEASFLVQNLHSNPTKPVEYLPDDIYGGGGGIFLVIFSLFQVS